MIDLYSAEPRVWRVRLATAIVFAGGGVLLWLSWEAALSYGMAPGDGGRLAPLWQRLAWAIPLASLGIGCIAGMWVYAGLYVRTISYEQATDRLQIYTLGVFGGRLTSVDAARIAGSTFHHGRMSAPGAPSVNAPWHNLWIEGRRLPLVLDAQGEVRNPALFRRLISGRGRRRGR